MDNMITNAVMHTRANEFAIDADAKRNIQVVRVRARGGRWSGASHLGSIFQDGMATQLYKCL